MFAGEGAKIIVSPGNGDGVRKEVLRNPTSPSWLRQWQQDSSSVKHTQTAVEMPRGQPTDTLTTGRRRRLKTH